MKKPIIAVDIDDTLAASSAGWVEYSNKTWGTHLKVEDYIEDWATMWQIDHETMKKRADQVLGSGVVKTFAKHEASVDVLKELSKRYELVITTSRSEITRSDTLAWLDEHYEGVFSNVHLTGTFDGYREGAHLLTKADLISDVGADYLIDDQLKHCFAVAENGVKAVLFGDYPWNQAAELPAGVVRCKDWLAVLEYFNGQSART